MSIVSELRKMPFLGTVCLPTGWNQVDLQVNLSEAQRWTFSLSVFRPNRYTLDHADHGIRKTASIDRKTHGHKVSAMVSELGLNTSSRG